MKVYWLSVRVFPVVAIQHGLMASVPPPQYKDAFMKANPGYKWCPTTNKPVKSPAAAVSGSRKKVWSFTSNAPKDGTAAKKVPKAESTPQLNFAMAGVPTNRRVPGQFSRTRFVNGLIA